MMLTCNYCAYLRKCIEKATEEGYEHNPDFEGEAGCPNFGFKRNTNADRIRAMSDEELAEWHESCPYIDKECTMKGCVKCVLDWLKQPAQEKL